MAISGKYGRIDIPKIGDNEPVFIQYTVKPRHSWRGYKVRAA
jgi:hypothetical protein